MRRALPSVLALLLLSASRAGANPVEIPYAYDPDFNGGHVVIDDFTLTGGRVYSASLVRAPGGDLVAVGKVRSPYYCCGDNVGLARYNPVSGATSVWPFPSPAFSYANGRYLVYPNAASPEYRVADALAVGTGVYALARISTGNGDVRIVNLSQEGNFVQDEAAFTTSLIEFPAGMVSYAYTAGGIAYRKLIAVATYINGNSRHVVTIRRFNIDGAGNLSVDNAFGVSGNGAMDQPLGDAYCNAGTDCSGDAVNVAILRADTANPTVFIAGNIPGERLLFVMAINGADGSLYGGFGDGGSGIDIENLDTPAGLAATTSAATGDLVYLAHLVASETCGTQSAVTKLFGRVLLPGGAQTTPDFSWGNGGTRQFGGPGCDGAHRTLASDLVINDSEIAVVGSEFGTGMYYIPQPLFVRVNLADGALREYCAYCHPPLRSDGLPWPGGDFSHVVADGPGRYLVSGSVWTNKYDSVFSTARLLSERIFGNGFD